MRIIITIGEITIGLLRRPLPPVAGGRVRCCFGGSYGFWGRGGFGRAVGVSLTAGRLVYLLRPGGVATALLKRTITVAHEADCEYIRCSANWDNEAETALFRKCGSALVDLDGEDEEESCYLAVRCVQDLEA